ncbi:MAG: carbohydrate kinase family protein [Anaerolineales bacterium]|nr:carbohydrate kinase family protein [Anaerolineae bacterium]MCB9129614.1 carbohydrate kinase family protein [Anaerolineales bacterium]MCO5245633.1 carbohydrate kinase family protein [Anaerolineae bacterium]HRX01791.1 carbohydrate kinase family protein [Anaerolineae bacterium]
MIDILVIGGASLDVLHFGGKTVHSAGGAGLYTSAAAARAGVHAAMFAPRPEPTPDVLQPALSRIEWLGPTVPPDQLPHFEIAHYGNGRAELVNARWGAEAQLSSAGLPADLSPVAFVHVAALGTTARQIEFVRSARARGAKRISAGTYGRAVHGETAAVQELLALADLFFMNENEAAGLFGAVDAARSAPGKLLFVTLGSRGALVIQGDHVTHVPGMAATELDPTGAGDTFCGATLAGLARGQHPVMAARQAIALAGQMIGAVGPAALWETGPLPQPAHDQRVALNQRQIEQVADLIAALPEVQPFDFIGPDFPPAGHPAALDYFFTSTLQQFSFWNIADGRYGGPLLAPLEGQTRKGSDYLWRAWLRPLWTDPDFYLPLRQAALSGSELAVLFRDDTGQQPMPGFDLHLDMARAYGRDLSALSWSPAGLVALANSTVQPLMTLLSSLDHVGGYKEDPLRKKAGLLALILQQRPERWLEPMPDEAFPPVIDYHLMRSCLRVGLIDVTDETLERALLERRLLEPADEWAVRLAAYEAVEHLVARSGRTMGAVDWFFFNARRRCPEMSEPECSRCAVDPVCAHRKALFQPVLRTTYY